MKYNGQIIMFLSLILALSSLLIAVTVFGIESATTGIIILAWLIGSMLLHFAIRGITTLSDRLVERYENQKVQEKRKRKHIDSIILDLSDSELLRLKRNLMDGAIDDEMVYVKSIDDSNNLYREQSS